MTSDVVQRCGVSPELPLVSDEVIRALEVGLSGLLKLSFGCWLTVKMGFEVHFT